MPGYRRDGGEGAAARRAQSEGRGSLFPSEHAERTRRAAGRRVTTQTDSRCWTHEDQSLQKVPERRGFGARTPKGRTLPRTRTGPGRPRIPPGCRCWTVTPSKRGEPRSMEQPQKDEGKNVITRKTETG